MSIDQNVSLAISQVSNGYVVSELDVLSGELCDEMVFQSFAEMVGFLGQHFTFRSIAAVESDKFVPVSLRDIAEMSNRPNSPDISD